MALRSVHALLGTFVRSGILCLAAGVNCIAHGLPETPDSFSLTPIAVASGCTAGIFVQSWDSSMMSFVNSHAAAANTYLRAAVEFSVVS